MGQRAVVRRDEIIPVLQPGHTGPAGGAHARVHYGDKDGPLGPEGLHVDDFPAGSQDVVGLDLVGDVHALQLRVHALAHAAHTGHCAPGEGEVGLPNDTGLSCQFLTHVFLPQLSILPPDPAGISGQSCPG